MQLQPCAGITCAGSRRTNVKPLPVQVDNGSPPVLSWPARYDCQTYLTLFFSFKQKMALTISYLDKLNNIYAWLSNVPYKKITFLPSQNLWYLIQLYTQCENVLIQLNRKKKRVWNRGLTFSFFYWKIHVFLDWAVYSSTKFLMPLALSSRNS